MPAILEHEFDPCSVLPRTSTIYELILYTNRPYTYTNQLYTRIQTDPTVRLRILYPTSEIFFFLPTSPIYDTTRYNI